MTVRSVKIVVTDEAIYFANTGRTMDRAGVISIANQDLSAKTDTSLVDRH